MLAKIVRNERSKLYVSLFKRLLVANTTNVFMTQP